MNSFIKFIQKRPSDLTIRVWRIVFWFIYIVVLYINFFVFEPKNTIQDSLFWIDISTQTKMIMTYIIIAFGLIPLVMWAINICIAKEKYIRIMEIIYAVLLFYFAHIIVDWPNLDIDSLVFFMAFLPLFWWITWKFITKRCRLHGVKKTKIRV
jgi:hypothetical protein